MTIHNLMVGGWILVILLPPKIYHYFIAQTKGPYPNYHRKLQTSLVGEFNRIQAELGKSPISDFTAFKWLKEERPKFAIYPHKVDYCDFCAIHKKDIQAKQQVIMFCG